MKNIEIKHFDEYIYAGAFDHSNEGKIITLRFNNEEVSFNLNDVVSDKIVFKQLSLQEIQELCKLCNIKFTLYPNGNYNFSKLDSNKDELKTCYVSIIKQIYVLIIAFDETQPGLYKAQLIGFFEK